jgi:hypothetical protein
LRQLIHHCPSGHIILQLAAKQLLLQLFALALLNHILQPDDAAVSLQKTWGLLHS